MDTNPLEVTTRMELAAFVTRLRVDLLTQPKGWENATLDSFLGALSVYLKDVDGWCKNMAPDIDPELATWRLFAITLVGAKVYE